MKKSKMTRSKAREYAHEDLCETRDYQFTTEDGRLLTGKETKTACGHWFSSCEDDTKNYKAELWRFNTVNDRPTCPLCVQDNPYEYPGMILVVVGGLGVPQIVQVSGDEEWFGIYGFSTGRLVSPESHKVCHVCQEGDVFEDINLAVRNGELVPLK